ncbi:T9SS type A sorting domain-containing protein, partial [Bacteroidota bacterium]
VPTCLDDSSAKDYQADFLSKLNLNAISELKDSEDYSEVLLSFEGIEKSDQIISFDFTLDCKINSHLNAILDLPETYLYEMVKLGNGKVKIAVINPLGIEAEDLLIRINTDKKLLNEVIISDIVLNNQKYGSQIITNVNGNNLLIEKFDLAVAYPNPFNPSTTIKYSIPKQSFIQLRVFDAIGREVKTLVNKEQSPGNYELEFDGSNLSSGIYFYRLQADNYIETKKMILMK